MISSIRGIAVVVMLTTLTGCSGDAALPGGASLVGESPRTLVFKAPEAGTVYIRDRKSGRVIYSKHLEAEQKFVADRTMNSVTIDGQAVAGAPTLTREAGYELFYKSAGQREYHPAYNP